MPLNIVIDESITFAQEAFSRFGRILLLNGRNMSNSVIKNADALIVRSTTVVNEELLHGSNIKFVGTATIGTDHIDEEYLTSNGITFSDAKGCNSTAVAEYFITALLAISVKNKIKLDGKSIGIVGVGNIGTKVKFLAEVLGLNIVLNDPPLKEKSSSEIYRPLEELLNCDIITIHTPLTLDGKHPTHHLFNEEVLGKLKEGVILINSSRGEVVDNIALLDILKTKKLYTAFDVFESEPNILTELVNYLTIATPHIAGYSYEGKINGTKMIYDAFCKHFSFKPIWQPEYPTAKNSIISLSNSESDEEFFYNVLSYVYPIENDDKDLRVIREYSQNARGKYFDTLRKEYFLRREFNNYYFDNTNISEERSKKLLEIGFNKLV